MVSACVDIKAVPGGDDKLGVVRLPPSQRDQLHRGWLLTVPDEDKVSSRLHVKVFDLEGDDLAFGCADDGQAFQATRILARPVIPGASKYLRRTGEIERSGSESKYLGCRLGVEVETTRLLIGRS